MAVISLPQPVVSRRTRSSSSHLPLLSLVNGNTFTSSLVPISNKYLPSENPDTPPPSPPSKFPSILRHFPLYPPNIYKQKQAGPLVYYEIDASGLVAALDHMSTQSLPDASEVFPWFYGLNPKNLCQTNFLTGERRDLRQTPTCFRGITLVKADGDLRFARLKGAIAPEEFLIRANEETKFRDVDPENGFSVRNFHIQAAKSAIISDIVIYGDDQIEAEILATDIAAAQKSIREEHDENGIEFLQYNTFICTSSFRIFEQIYPDFVVIDSCGNPTGALIDLFHRERTEMRTMTKASEIDNNVWLGPTPETIPEPTLGSGSSQRFDIFVECGDFERFNPADLRENTNDTTRNYPLYLEFPYKNIMADTRYEADNILETCKFLYYHSHGIPFASSGKYDPCSDSPVSVSERKKRILIHCRDGYTESSLLGLSYLIYTTGLPLHSVLINLHVSKERDFFVHPADISLLSTLSLTLLAESPVHSGKSFSEISDLAKQEPQWLKKMNNFFPSRITKYMYLGNIGHANNPELLSQIGISQVLSIGEIISWEHTVRQAWGEENLMALPGIQDNGIDPLTDEIERCLEFIANGRSKNTATLVHCKVGVSRSATICIAEVIRSFKMSSPQAYCFVRARRLNIIIQPHLRFAYELLKWEEKLHSDKANGELKREMEWAEMARQISAINRPFSR